MENEEQDTERETRRSGKSGEYWRGEVQQWQSSGLTQKEYCNKEGLSLERFGTWKRRFDRKGSGRGALVAVPSAIVSSALLERRQGLGLIVSERYRVEIPDRFSPATLEQVLQVLARL